MASGLSTASGDVSIGKIESPVVENEASTTGQESNEDSTVADSEAVSQLQSEVMSLELRLKNCYEAKQQLEDELADLEDKSVILIDGIQIREESIDKLKNENQQLRQQLQTTGASVQPGYEAIRDRTLNKLKVGKQSTAGKAIEAFIKELTRGTQDGL